MGFYWVHYWPLLLQKVMENRNLYIIGGIGLVAVIILVLRRSASSPTVIQSGVPQTSDPNQARLAQSAINADIFKTLSGFVFSNEAQKIQGGLGYAQIEAGRTLGLAQTTAATEVAKAQNTLQSQAIAAARDVGIAQANAETIRAQNYNDALASQQSAANRSQLLNSLFSQLGNILRSIGGGKPSSSGGGSSGGSSIPTTSGSRPPTVRLNPSLPSPNELETFWIGDIPNPYDLIFPDSGFDFPSGFQESAPSPYGNENFYVEDPTFSSGSVFGYDEFNNPMWFGSFGGEGGYIDLSDYNLGEPPEAP